MASRAHYIQDHFGHVGERPRRAVRYPDRDDRISLPTDRSSSSGALLASALIATSLIAGGVYALYASGRTTLAQTEAAPLAPRWQLDSEPVLAQNMALTEGPARAVPSVVAEPEVATEPAPEQTDTSAPGDATPDYAPMPTTPATPAPATPAPAPIGPEAPRQPLYPDPTTTPPDAIAPPEVGAERATPLLDPENPYQ